MHIQYVRHVRHNEHHDSEMDIDFSASFNIIGVSPKRYKRASLDIKD